MPVREPYVTSTGEVVPSVTTIISRFKDSGPLVWWANKQGLQGLTLEAARQPAMTTGTMAHELVEAKITNQPMPELIGEHDAIEKARAAFKVYEHWQSMTHLEIKHSEVALVSDKHRFGGRLDAIGDVGGHQALVDFKVANSIYSDYILQIAAYGILWDEAHPEEPLTGGYHLLRFSKEQGDFSHHYFPRLEAEKEAFLLMVDLYRRVKEIDRRVK
jgi:hypothetical protein